MNFLELSGILFWVCITICLVILYFSSRKATTTDDSVTFGKPYNQMTDDEIND